MTTVMRAFAWAALASGILWPALASTQNADPATGGLQCSVDGDSVTISWAAAGEDVTLISGGILARDGAVIAVIPAGTGSHVESSVPPGTHVYILTLAYSNGVTTTGQCAVVVGEETPGVRCEVSGRVVTVTWTISDDILAFGFIVSRDGEIMATLGPEARSYSDEAPPGEHTYVVSTNNRLGRPDDPAVGAPDYLIGECRVVVEGEPGLPGPRDLRCAVAESFPVQVQLWWTNPVSYDSIIVIRDNLQIATLEESATRFSEFDPGAGQHLYEVRGVKENQLSPPATCVVETSGPPASDRLYMVPSPAATTGDPDTDPAGNAGNDGTPATDTVTVLLSSGRAVQAWSFGIASDATILVVAEATTAETDAGALNEGKGPTFLVIKVLEGGVTMAAIIDEEDPADVLPLGDGHSLLRVRYAPGPGAARGTPYVVYFSSALGDPPVETLIVADGFEVYPAISPGVVSFAARGFLRGDGDNDGLVNITDAVSVLDWLFRGGAEPACLEAADANASLGVNIADAVYLLQALFIGGPEPPAPYPECGSAPVALGCDVSACE
jgi:hypothetical protein